MDSFFKQLDKGLDSIAGKLEKMERKWNEGGGGAGEEGVGDTYSINNSRYRIVKKLAEGGFAFVYLAEQVETGRPVALKRILVQDDEHLEIIRREINFLKTLSGKEGIIPFLGAASFKKPNRHEVIVLTEYCPRGSVLNLMYQRERNRMTETEILFIFETVCKAVYHMHCMDPPIAHRDLKVENVLVGKNGSLYLIDFGSATVVTYDTDKPHIRNIAENDINRNTTLLYRAPEMVDLYRKQIINEKCDVWALGCMLYKMMYYADPFDGKLGILNARYRAPDFPPYTPKMHDLLRYLMTADPEKRPDICDVLEKLGSPMPRVHRKSAPAREASPSTERENGSGAGGAKDLFAMLDWQKNDGSSPSSTQRSSAREARSHSPSVPNGSSSSSSVGSQSLIDDFEQKVSISGSSSSTTTTSASSNGPDDFFANFDAVARQPSPAPAVGSGSTATTTANIHNNNNNDDGWGDFSTFSSSSSSSSSSSTSSSSMPAAPVAFGLESLMGAASPASLSPAPAARPQPEKKDILSLYGTDASSPATPALFGSHGSPYGSGTASPVPGQTYNSLPMGGMPMGVVYAAAPAGTPVYMMAAPQAAVGLGSPMTSPLYARAPTPSYGSGPSPLVPHVGGGGGLTPVSTPPLTPISARSASPLSSSSATGASAQGPASGGDPFAALWNTASK